MEFESLGSLVLWMGNGGMKWGRRGMEGVGRIVDSE